MTVNIAIIGLGQTGTSVGLALAEHKNMVHRTGHDIILAQARRAEKQGALDEVNINLPASVEKADLVVLALPIDQIRNTLQVIAPVLRQGAVVVDLVPVKQVVLEWARQILPAGRHYVGLAAVRNPLYLDTPEHDADTGRADLFRHSVIAVVTPPGVAPEAIRLATDFVSLLGGEHLFVDPQELDGLIAATHILPELLSSALIHATVPQPGWKEARKFADRAYASVSRPAARSNTPAAIASLALNSPENTLRVLDNVMASLQTLRGLVEKQDAQGLQDYFKQARRSREEWWQERGGGNWAAEEGAPAEMPTSSEVFGRLFGIGKPKKSKPQR